MTVKQWVSPNDAIADALFDAGDRVEALMETGETLQIFFGDLTSDDEDHWMGFYNDDGQEILMQEIRSVRSPQTTAV